ncbi:MAG: DUF2330 domain-containing protein [Phycisphaeraceae bacterium]|nr:DUF2330 domain-containing protein [Phycisphaeraceae bacterium]
MAVMFRALICAALLVCSPALGDGKIFAGHAAPAEIPEQSALIVYDGRVETLAIETRFAAKGRDFAWVVPLPAKPEIRAGTAGMFPTLRGMFLPRMWVFEGAGVVIGLLLFWCVGCCLVMLGAGSAGARIAAWGTLAWLLVTSCVMSSLGLARGGGGDFGAVTVIERALIGDFDVSVVQSADAGEIKGWLAENGVGTSPDADRAIEDYVKRGWFFAVSKLRRSFDEARLTAPTPLIFKFAASKPVYPMQLTGAGATAPLRLELFVFGKSFAFASGFDSVRRADVEILESGQGYYWRGSTNVRVSHALVKEVVGDAPCATLLRRTLRPGDMNRDIDIEFAGASRKGNSIASKTAALQMAIAMGLTAFLISGAGLSRWAAQIGPWPAGLQGLGMSLAAGIVGFLLTWHLIPAVSEASKSGISDYKRMREIQSACSVAIDQMEKQGPAKNKEASLVAEAAVRLLQQEFGYPNDVRVEDSPGNFIIREKNGEIQCVYFNWNGQETVETLRY